MTALRIMPSGRGGLAAHAQSGMTLIELMVAMVISLLIALAAMAALSVASRGFGTVDAASQLRDNARFSNELISRILSQGGFEDVPYATTTRKVQAGMSTNPPPNVQGFNNATLASTDPINSGVARTDSTIAGYGSDVLVVLYQAGETYPGSGKSDGTMIDCKGNALPDTAIPVNRDDRMASIFHVDVVNGEPSLMCTTATISGASVTTVGTTAALIPGVEQFQVLYGVDGVTANTAYSGTTPPVVADRYLRADQIVVSGDAVGTSTNWRRVRSVRIGMLFRSAAGKGQQQATSTLYPFGLARSSSGGADGSAFSSGSDPGTSFSVPSDNRIRQSLTFTVHLRNTQTL